MRPSNFVRKIAALVLAGSLASGAAWGQASVHRVADRSRQSGNRAYDRLVREVRHELLMLPFLSLFDDLSFRIDGGTVTLLGYATRPVLKSDAENAVKRIEGVDRVVNDIEVLPLSPMDDRIRIAAARLLFSNPALTRYAFQAIPPIHIIVKNGNLILEGVVASETDKNIAGMEASSVPGVFSVTNNLRVESRQ